MDKTQIFPSLMIALGLGAALMYALGGNMKMMVYWVAASVLTASITFMKDGEENMKHPCNSSNHRCYPQGECPAKEKCLWFARKESEAARHVSQENEASKTYAGQGND